MEKELMDGCLLLIRHCSAEGPAPESPLTEAGKMEAMRLSDVLARYEVGRILSSPFLRAYQSIEPFASRSGISIEADARLREFDLGDTGGTAWIEAWSTCLVDLDLQYPGGESGRLATQRILAVVEEAQLIKGTTTVIVTHGRLLSLLLKHLDDSFNFERWRRLTNPDVFRISLAGRRGVAQHMWERGERNGMYS